MVPPEYLYHYFPSSGAKEAPAGEEDFVFDEPAAVSAETASFVLRRQDRFRWEFGIRMAHLGAFVVAVTFGSLLIVKAQAKKWRPDAHIPFADELEMHGERSRQLAQDLVFQGMNDVAMCDFVHFDGPPPGNVVPTSTAPSSPVSVPAYIFLPHSYNDGGSHPLLVYVHGGIHGRVGEEDIPILHELVAQGYAVVAPDYRGSSGYGKEHWELIDYGGREVDDVRAARTWMLKRYDRLDPFRVGVLGFSHGGAISMMLLARFPEEFRAAFVGVPVCDLRQRIRYKDQEYRDLFSAPYHLGCTLEQNPEEYFRRSAIAYVPFLKNPLRIHAASNDQDVLIREILDFVAALREAGRSPEFHLFENVPGGHDFMRLDNPTGRESRLEMHRFLAEHLAPPSPLADPSDVARR